jgi:fatty-acyl-CoA synthase
MDTHPSTHPDDCPALAQNEKATEATFKGGWLNTGDLAVQHKYGRIQIRDRSKDVIIR